MMTTIFCVVALFALAGLVRSMRQAEAEAEFDASISRHRELEELKKGKS